MNQLGQNRKDVNERSRQLLEAKDYWPKGLIANAKAFLAKFGQWRQWTEVSLSSGLKSSDVLSIVSTVPLNLLWPG